MVSVQEPNETHIISGEVNPEICGRLPLAAAVAFNQLLSLSTSQNDADIYSGNQKLHQDEINGG